MRGKHAKYILIEEDDTQELEAVDAEEVSDAQESQEETEKAPVTPAHASVAADTSDGINADESDVAADEAEAAEKEADEASVVDETDVAAANAAGNDADASDVADAADSSTDDADHDFTAPIEGVSSDEASSDPTVKLDKVELSESLAQESASSTAPLEAVAHEEDADEVLFDTKADVTSEADDEAPAAYEPTFDLIPEKRHKGLKRAGIALACIVGLAAAVYVGGALAFSNWIMPGTTLAGQDISMKSNDEVVQIIDGLSQDYNLSIKGGQFALNVDGQQLGLDVSAAKTVEGIHGAMNSWEWPLVLLNGQRDMTGQLSVRYNAQSLKTGIDSALESYNAAGTPTVDAHVDYNAASHSFVVAPEAFGTQYDPSLVYEDAQSALNGLQRNVELTQDDLFQPKVFADDEKLSTAAFEATKLIQADVHLNMGGIDVATIGPDMLHGLVSFDANMKPTLDEATIAQYVDDLVKSMNTIGSERTYTREDGKEITVSGGAYGWEITDPEAVHDQVLAMLQKRESGTVEIECDRTAEAFEGPGKKDWGSRYIDVDLSEQYVRFYDDGDIIWESYCISGTPDGENDTNPGVWYITRKESPSMLIGWKNGQKMYESPVRYWMPFEGNVIGLHDADWQPDFGGQMYRQGYGSHGCVNLPVYKAEELYYIVDVNDVVVVHW